MSNFIEDKWIHVVCFLEYTHPLSCSVCSAGSYSADGAVNLALNKPTLDSTEFTTCRSFMAVDGSRYLGPCKCQ